METRNFMEQKIESEEWNITLTISLSNKREQGESSSEIKDTEE